VWAYPLTEETAGKMREQLEARRGTAEQPSAAAPIDA
jgi:hypothetical protein